MVARECLKNVTLLLDVLEGNIIIPREEQSKYGYRDAWYSSRANFWMYKVKDFVAIEASNREYLSKTMLKEMKEFLEKAIELGFYGTVVFRTGYSHGMYASTRVTKDNEREGQIYLYHAFDTEIKTWGLRNDRKENIKIVSTYREIKKIAQKYLKGEPIDE